MYPCTLVAGVAFPVLTTKPTFRFEFVSSLFFLNNIFKYFRIIGTLLSSYMYWDFCQRVLCYVVKLNKFVILYGKYDFKYI